MSLYTPTYRLGYLKRGSIYSAEIDRRRFVTLDYNMEDYVGIVGVGVISGWKIEPTDTPLQVKVLPGTGIINGYYSESEYEFKQRSSMVVGDREVEVVNDDDIPEPPLEGTARSTYIAIIQDYNPSYNPSPSDVILNSWVKTVNPNVAPNLVTLADNSDSYIIAERVYPTFKECWDNFVYAPTIGEKPSISSYAKYSDFKAAMAVYDASLAARQAYNWRAYTQNHFTKVSFSTQTSYFKSVDKILIGKVVIRSGIIKKIDYKQVDSLENLQATIKEKAKPYIAGHVHGGNQSFDPPKIQLRTDIRRCVLSKYKSVGQVCTFSILEGSETSIDVGHKHTYKIDANGNGNTVEIIGTDKIHFHKINEYVVGNQEYTNYSIETHNHTISEEIQEISDEATYVVYINDIPITSNYSVDLTKKELTIYGLMGEVYKTYFSTFDFDYINPNTGKTENKTYSFEKSSFSVLSFMLDMMLDFGEKYPSNLTDESVNATNSVLNNPFLFQTSDGGYAGVEDIAAQSEIAQVALKKVGDQFTFTPNAAKNVNVIVKEVNGQSISDYQVEIEILGNTEVTGVLRDENVLYVNAEKFKMGIFDIARIPPLNHIGRMGEEFIPYQYPLVSTDGVSYTVTPAITTVELDHYHKLVTDSNVTGTTHNTYVSEDPVYYMYSNGVSYLIAHNHGVENGVLLESEGRDLAEWQNTINGSNLTSALHIHDVIPSVKGDPKVIYSIAETANGSIVAGTSSGLYLIPNGNAYSFIINGVPIYEIGEDLWDLLLSAKAEYELQTGNELVVTEDIYLDNLLEASENLVSDGDSVLIKGGYTPTNPNGSQDTIMLQKVDSFLLPNFRYQGEKPLNQVSADETIIDIKLVFNNGTTATQDDIDSFLSSGSQDDLKAATVELATYEKNLHPIPIWSIVTDISGNIFVCGAKEYSKTTNIESNLYTDWSNSSKPNYFSALKKIYKDSQGNVWCPTEKGLMVARYYQNGNVLEIVNNPGIGVNVSDVIEKISGKIYVATNIGISLTEDYGKTWTIVLPVSGGCTKILKDSSNTLYSITNKFVIYSSVNGTTWNTVGAMLQQEYGDIIVFNGYFYACTTNGLYRATVTGSSWERVFDQSCYSLSILLDGSGFLVGGDKDIYVSIDGVSYNLITSLSGSAAPSLYSDSNRKTFGYAYNSNSQQFFFKEVTYTETPTSSLVDFNKWIAAEGSWSENALYDIYIDRQLVYSTKKNIDNRTSSGNMFSVDTEQGILDFGAKTVLTEATEIYDSFIAVEDSSGFSAGDRIYVVCTKSIPNPPTRPTSMTTILDYFQKLTEYYNEKTKIENMYFYAEVSSVSTGKIFVSTNINQVIEMPATVYKIPDLSGSTTILSNIYDSMLFNIGSNNHEELDDLATYATDNRPYLLNNSYLSNLLQLTQAVKYVYPNIDEYMVNTKFFDFKYSWDPLDPDKPYIGDIIDLYSSEAYNDGLYDSQFTSKKSKMVNKILIGTGSFSDYIFAATDVGLFYAKFSVTMENNWFYVYAMPFPVYDLMISNTNRLLAATNDGLYQTTDVSNWTKFSQPSIDFPIYTMSYRWSGRSTVVVPNHAVIITNVDGKGKITASAGTPYSSIQLNRIINISESTNGKNGNYSVIAVSPTEIVVSEEFTGTVPVTDTIKIKMGSWWEYLDGDVSTDDNLITNTLVAGGKSMIAFATNVASTLTSNEIIWRQSELPTDLPKFATSDVLPLSSGIALSSIVGTTTNEENDLLQCKDSGTQWTKFKSFTAVKGNVISKLATYNGHTTLKVEYTMPVKYLSEDYSLNSKEIAFFRDGILLLKTYVLANEMRNNINYITVYGQGIIDALNQGSNVVFVVYPFKVNKMLELSDNNLLYATNQGLYSDEGSVVNYSKKSGQINQVASGGIVTKIDIGGIISSVSMNSVNQHVTLSLKSTDSITINQLKDMMLYVIDLSDPIPYMVVSNSGLNVNGEFIVEINIAYTSLWSTFKGKRVTIVGSNSKVYLTFNSNIVADQFKDGIMYVSSDENDNMGKSYSILSNTESYLVLKTSIVPRSSFVSNNDSVITGQSVKLMDATRRVKLYVTFKESALLNEYVGYTFRIEDSDSTLYNQSMSIYSNTPYEIVLNPVADVIGEMPFILQLENTNLFSITGNVFAPIQNFNTSVLTESLDHYHTALLIGKRITGTINTITQDGTAYMNITMINTDGFDSAALLADGTIIDGCRVTLFNPQNRAFSYETTAVSYVSGTLKLRVNDASKWNTGGYNESKISISWFISIESQLSGITSGTFYRDFVSVLRYLTSDISEGEDIVYVGSTTNIYSGDKVELFDNTGKSLITYVASVIDSESLELSDASDNSFQVINGAGIKVLRDVFSNNHMHSINDAQVKTLVVTDYLEFGYPSTHSHRISPYISDVTDLAIYDGSVFAVGSSEFIYVSYDNGSSWKMLVDLNKSLEWDEEIVGTSRISVSGSMIIVGTTNGQIFSNTIKEWQGLPLEKP